MGSGMEETYQVTSALRYLEWGREVAVITDARFSGVSTGACIGHVAPEALAGGPIGRLLDGDRIRIMIDRRRLEGRVDFVGDATRELTPEAAAARVGGTSARGPIWPPTRDCPTIRGCGRRCSGPAAARGPAACTTSSGSCNCSKPDGERWARMDPVAGVRPRRTGIGHRPHRGRLQVAARLTGSRFFFGVPLAFAAWRSAPHDSQSSKAPITVAPQAGHVQSGRSARRSCSAS